VRVDVVDEREDVLLVTRVVAHGQGHRDLPALVHYLDCLRVDGLARLVQVGHEFRQATLGVIVLAAKLRVLLATILERDRHPAVQERQLAHTVREGVESVLGLEKDGVVRSEVDSGSGLLARLQVAHLLDSRHRNALFVRLPPQRTLPAHLHFQPRRQRVHAADTNSVESARDLVGVLVELAARVEHRHHDLHGRPVFRGMQVHGDASTIVHDRDRVVLVDHYLDVVAVPR
jgi:hypothetical protein